MSTLTSTTFKLGVRTPGVLSKNGRVARAPSASARRTATVMALSNMEERRATVLDVSRSALATSAAVANLLIAGAALAEEEGGFPVAVLGLVVGVPILAYLANQKVQDEQNFKKNLTISGSAPTRSGRRKPPVPRASERDE